MFLHLDKSAGNDEALPKNHGPRSLIEGLSSAATTRLLNRERLRLAGDAGGSTFYEIRNLFQRCHGRVSGSRNR